MTLDDLLPIPPAETATEPIHSSADLRQRWRALMGELGFGERLLWIGFVGPDRRLFKTLTQVPLSPRPRRSTVEPAMGALVDVLDQLDEDVTVALLLTRPGRGPVSDADRRWAALLLDVAAGCGLAIEPIFRANDEALVEVLPEQGAAA